MSVGSQTTHAMTRANLAGAVDARLKLQEIAANDLGGAPHDYTLGDERVYRRDNPSRGLTYAQAAQRARSSSAASSTATNCRTTSIAVTKQSRGRACRPAA